MADFDDSAVIGGASSGTPTGGPESAPEFAPTSIVTRDDTPVDWHPRYKPWLVTVGLQAILWLPPILAWAAMGLSEAFGTAETLHSIGAWWLLVAGIASPLMIWLANGMLAPIESLKRGEMRHDGLIRDVHRTIYRLPGRLLRLSLVCTILFGLTAFAVVTASPPDPIGVVGPMAQLGIGLGMLLVLAAVTYVLTLVTLLPTVDAPLSEIGLSRSEKGIRLRDLILSLAVMMPAAFLIMFLLFAIPQVHRVIQVAATEGPGTAAVAIPEILARLGALGILMLLLAIRFSSRMHAVLIQPLESITRVADSIARGDLRQNPILLGSRDEMGRMALAVNRALYSLRELVVYTNAVAEGDLRIRLTGSGEMAKAFNRLVGTQMELVRQLTETSVQINSAAAQIYATSRESESNASEQASSVEETKRTMATLLDSSARIAESAHTVYGNAEKTMENVRVIAERLADLVAHNQKIGEVLDFVREIADRSDLLALNASLEGTRAGEAGRGFSLVASEMRRLAENVMEAVTTIKQLVADVRSSSQASVLATEEGTKLGDQTTESARLITYITQQQQSGTEQVSKSMDEIGDLLGQSVAGARQATQSADELRSLSEQLQDLIGRFDIEDH